MKNSKLNNRNANKKPLNKILWFLLLSWFFLLLLLTLNFKNNLLEKSIKSGFSNFYISVNYLKDQIIDYFQDGQKWGVKIKYLVENKPCGTAGSLGLIKDKIDLPILVINSDVLTGLDYKLLLSFHEKNKSMATICSRNYKVDIPFGVFNSDGIEFQGLDEKPTVVFQVNAGIYVINPELLNLIKFENFLREPHYHHHHKQ